MALPTAEFRTYDHHSPLTKCLIFALLCKRKMASNVEYAPTMCLT